MTLIPSLTFTELWVVSMEHLQRVWYASRERLPFRTLCSVPLFGTCLCSNCWDQIPRTCHVFIRLYTSNTPLVLSRFCLPNRPVNLKIARAISALAFLCIFVLIGCLWINHWSPSFAFVNHQIVFNKKHKRLYAQIFCGALLIFVNIVFFYTRKCWNCCKLFSRVLYKSIFVHTSLLTKSEKSNILLINPHYLSRECE